MEALLPESLSKEVVGVCVDVHRWDPKEHCKFIIQLGPKQTIEIFFKNFKFLTAKFFTQES